MPNLQFSSHNCQNTPKIRVKPEVLDGFAEFMKVNMRLERQTVRDSRSNIQRFLESADYVVSYETVAKYLKTYMKKSPMTYNAQITSLRRFIRDYLHAPQIVVSFKLAPVNYLGKNIPLPSKTQLKKAFEILNADSEKALFLFTASTGLRRSEILHLTKDKINFNLRAVIPQHFTRVKRSGITFYTEEAETWLRRYLSSRNSNSQKVFQISDRKCKVLWKTASQAAGLKISPQVLRVWFSMEMGEQGIPDRFIDIFQGRAPRTVLAKHYTNKGVERLKAIYDKADLNIM